MHISPSFIGFLYTDVYRALALLLEIRFWGTSRNTWLTKGAMKRKLCSVVCHFFLIRCITQQWFIMFRVCGFMHVI